MPIVQMNPSSYVFIIFAIAAAAFSVREALASDLPSRGELLYQNNFSSTGDTANWILEGPGEITFNNGWMHMRSPEQTGHHVLWCPEDFPESFIAEWEAQNLKSDAGLCIVFFAAQGVNGEDIFDPSLPKRDGDFSWYIKDRINSYHISYYANTPKKPDRETANLRKNNTFNLVQEGSEGIPSDSTAIHQIKLIKEGPHIRMFIDGRKVIDWTDTEENEPRPYYKDGKIGMRQMQWTHFRYRNFRVWEIEDPLPEMVGLPLIHAKQRMWADPAFDRPAKANPPSLKWPRTTGKAITYDVRLSQDVAFPPESTFSAEGLAWCLYNPHRALDQGRWYWQHRKSGGEWSDLQSFLITAETRSWDPPTAEAFLASIPSYHPRRLADAPHLAEFRKSAAGTREAARIQALADRYIGQPAPVEDESVADLKGADAKKTDKIQKDASKEIGNDLYKGIDPLCKAFLLTGDERYVETAIKWAMEASAWDPAGVTRINDFGDARVMLSMATVYDTFYERLGESQRAALLSAVRARASYLFKTYINNKEAALLSNHVWQHIVHYFFDTAIAVHGDLPEAGTWLNYLYEIFLARAPVLGGKDGGWVHGLSYFRMNMETLVDIPQRIKQYTGFDFIAHTPWYAENTNYFLYGFPPGSAGTGFADNSHDLPEPRDNYLAYADALSRLQQNPYAAWYRDRIREVTSELKPHIQAYWRNDYVSDDRVEVRLEDTDMLQWNRLKYLYDIPGADPQSPAELPKARAFKGVGLVTMHAQSLDQLADGNLFVAMRASPFGTYSHMLSDNNTFNMVYGGDRLFYHTGYKVAMSAPHRQQYYKHTKSHNGILIDGEGQPYSTEAYAWIENFLTGDKLSYAVGNASNAYDSKAENMDAGLRTFKRHVLMLRPDIVVVYDELEAEKPVEWSYLLHSYNEISLDEKEGILATFNRAGHARVYLTGSSELVWSVTDEYEVPANNWRMIRDEDGNLIEYTNDAWHFAAKSEKTGRMRFLGVYQVRPKDGESEPEFNELQLLAEGKIRVGRWQISAELDAQKPAAVTVLNTIDGVAFTSGGALLELQGKRFSGRSPSAALLVEERNGELIVQETLPEPPPGSEAARRYFKDRSR